MGEKTGVRRVDLGQVPSLDAAWHAADRARPGWKVRGLLRRPREAGRVWIAWAEGHPDGEPIEGQGASPVEALTDLAARLRTRTIRAASHHDPRHHPVRAMRLPAPPVERGRSGRDHPPGRSSQQAGARPRRARRHVPRGVLGIGRRRVRGQRTGAADGRPDAELRAAIPSVQADRRHLSSDRAASPGAEPIPRRKS